MKNRSSCVGLTPLDNLKNCCISRPPLVLFTVGLIILTAAFIYLAQYVKDTELIPDPNYNTDWEKFLTDLDSMSWSTNSQCVKNTDTLPKEEINVTDRISIIVHVQTSESLNMKRGSEYQATIWKDAILPREKLDRGVNVAMVRFSQSFTSAVTASNQVMLFGDSNHTDSNRSRREAGKDLTSLCMTIATQKSFLSSKLKKPETCTLSAPAAAAPSAEKLYLCDKTPAAEAASFSVVYRPKVHQYHALKMYLSDNDRMNIHIHLMSTSYFLVVVVIIVLLYGLIKRRVHGANSEAANPLVTNDV